MKKVIIDTNFLLIPFQFNIDVISEIENVMMEPYNIFVLDKTIDELKRIAEEQKGKNSNNAKLALEYIKCKADVIKTEKGKYVDDLIISLADKETVVCTQDKNLKKRVKENKAKVIEMKQKSYLILN